MKIKRVTRKWTRKDGTQVIRNYTYTRNSKYSDVNHTLLTKEGTTTKFYDKLVERLREAYGADAESYINQLDTKINKARKTHKAYTEATFRSQMADSARERYFFNMGGDIDEIASELKINRDILADDAYWEHDNFTYNGFVYSFKFDYDNGGISWVRRPQ